MLTRLLLALLFFFVLAPHASSQDGINARLSGAFESNLPMLRSEVIVTSNLVTIGDLFDNAGRFAETPVFRAPEPATRGSVPVHLILEASQNAGLEQVDLAGLSEVTVERAGVVLSGDAVMALVEAKLQDRLVDLYGQEGGEYTLTPNTIPSSITVGIEDADRLVVDVLSAPMGRSNLFSTRVRTQAGETLARIDGRAEHMIDVPVLSRALSRGDVVRQSDIRMQSLPYAQVSGSPTLMTTDDMVGQAANRSLRAGSPLSPEDLTAPLMVERQDLVTLVYRHGSLALTVRARAMDNGAIGQSIDVMNLQSNQIVRGLVAGHRLVHVLAPVQEIATTSMTSANVERIQ